jgi:membrane-bound lytic murein transglycosylase D
MYIAALVSTLVQLAPADSISTPQNVNAPLSQQSPATAISVVPPANTNSLPSLVSPNLPLAPKDAPLLSVQVGELAGPPFPEFPFPQPPALREAILFWRTLFLQYTSEQVVIHDREHMNVVWSVIELPKDEHGAVDEQEGESLAHQIVTQLRADLQTIADDPLGLPPDHIVFKAIPDLVNWPHLADAAQRVRSQRGVADHFRAGLCRARSWMPEIITILKKEDVPTEIGALPFVESMFNPQARSSAGAAGIWQLMPATARGLGLVVKRDMDERRDVLRSTRAAVRMLKRNYAMLGTWPLAITAYNHGPYGVRRAVEQVGSNDLTELIDRYQKSTWGFASKNFYAEFLAVVDILRTDPDSFLSQLVIRRGERPALCTQSP